MKWQTGAVSGIVGLGFILAVVLNLTGMSYSTDGDKICTDCFSKIEVNSTYWNVCVEHAGDKTALFRKSLSPVLYINLDKVDEIVTTNPEVKVDLMVKTIKSSAEVTNEYGYLRKAKDGDCIIKRITKSNPNPSRFYLHGSNVTRTIKWNFDVESTTIEDINIDPIWNGINVSWLCDNEYQQQTNPVYQTVTYEFTCPTGKNVSVNTQGKYAECINRVWRPSNNSWDYSLNFSHIYDKAYLSNRTIYWNESIFDYNQIINTTICHHVGIIVGSYTLNYSKCNVNCDWNNPTFSCDICEGDSNCDGILQSGESGFKKDLNVETITLNRMKTWWKVDNGNRKITDKLRDCIEEV